MRNDGGKYVQYDIYKDQNFSQRWGSHSSEILGGLEGDGLSNLFVGFGLVPGQPTPATGKYTNQVVVTVEY